MSNTLDRLSCVDGYTYLCIYMSSPLFSLPLSLLALPLPLVVSSYSALHAKAPQARCRQIDLVWSLCRGPAFAAVSGIGTAPLLYDCCLSCGLSCRGLALLSHCSFLDSCALREQDGLGLDHLVFIFSWVLILHFVVVHISFILQAHAGLGCMFLGSCQGGRPAVMLQSWLRLRVSVLIGWLCLLI